MGDLEAAVCIALETESHAASGGFQGEPLDHPLPAPGQLLYARPFATFANHHQVWVNGEPRWCAECAVEACAIFAHVSRTGSHRQVDVPPLHGTVVGPTPTPLRRRSCAAVSRTRSGSNNPARHWPRSPASGDVPSRWHRLRRRVRAHGPGGTKEQYMKTVIVGGVAAGASTGARLRRLDESAEIVMLERDHYVSFANCGLPYHIGGAIPDRDSLLLQTPESLAKSLALDVRTGQDVIRIDRDAKEVEVRDVEAGADLPGVLRQARAVPRGRADPAADPGCRRPARRRAAQHPRHGPHHRPARRGRHERRRRRRQLHRAGAHRGLPGTRAADHRGRADRAADAVAGPGDDPDPGLPRPHPRRGPPARHVGQGRSPGRRTTGWWSTSPTARRSRPTSSSWPPGRARTSTSPATPASRSGRAAASWSTRRCAPRPPTSSRPATPSRPLTC